MKHDKYILKRWITCDYCGKRINTKDIKSIVETNEDFCNKDCKYQMKNNKKLF